AYSNGRYGDAIELARSVQSMNPARAWRIIGAAACNIKDVKLASEASKQLDAAGRQYIVYSCQRNSIILSDGQPNAPALVRSGKKKLDDGELAAAAALFARAVEADPQNAEA